MAQTLSSGTFCHSIEEGKALMERKTSDKSIRWICGILFAAFAFCWLYFFQRELLCAASNELLQDNETLAGFISKQYLAVSLLLTLVALLLAIPGRILLRFAKGLYACNYLFSALFIGVITGYDEESLLGQTRTEWIVAGACTLVLFLVCKVVSSVPKSKYNDRPRSFAGNLLIMCLLFCMVGILGNTNEYLHRRLKIESLYSQGEYERLLQVGRYEKETDVTVDLLRAKAMLELPADGNPKGSRIGDMLFNYSILVPSGLANELDYIDNPQAYLASCLLKRDITSFADSINLDEYKTLPAFYMQALILADDSRASVKFPQQYQEARSEYDSFLNALESVKDELQRIQANTTYITYHTTYYWFYTFR